MADELPTVELHFGTVKDALEMAQTAIETSARLTSLGEYKKANAILTSAVVVLLFQVNKLAMPSVGERERMC